MDLTEPHGLKPLREHNEILHFECSTLYDGTCVHHSLMREIDFISVYHCIINLLHNKLLPEFYCFCWIFPILIGLKDFFLAFGWLSVSLVCYSGVAPLMSLLLILGPS